ncbi:MAG: phosphoribosylformylglycinamidine cyclo-ligase [Thermaerobacter sp.]|nr:phosphoribosylformylglycinamidine cyclo-ligase [Thermaerobacter sp.]
MRIRPLAETTRRPEVVAGIGGFAGAFRVDQPTTVLAGTDGVGSKILIAQALHRDETIGIDLVAMNVNDVLAAGGEPLFFLDYLAVGHLDPQRVAILVSGVAEGCRQAGCALLGGETAEMPDLYGEQGYDLAGFVVARQSYAATPAQPGDRIVGVASSGFHANGYALLRAVVRRAGLDLSARYPATGERTLGETLLTPTQIYVRPVMALWPAATVRAMAHITGGGLVENVGRTLPEGLGAQLEAARWRRPEIFDWFREIGEVACDEMYRTFNMGIGFTLVVPPAAVADTIRHFAQHALAAYEIGEVVAEPGVSIT